MAQQTEIPGVARRKRNIVANEAKSLKKTTSNTTLAIGVSQEHYFLISTIAKSTDRTLVDVLREAIDHYIKHVVVANLPRN